MDLYNLFEIETELRKIADIICKNGLDNFFDIKGMSIDDFLKDYKKYSKDFIVSCHTVFKVAQDRIITNILSIQKEQDLVRSQLKQARREKQKK